MACSDNNCISVCSYNMHGFKGGFSMLRDLCSSNMLIAVQEHWLLEGEINKFNLVCNNILKLYLE